MTRKEFLTQVWKKGFRPLLILAVAYFFLKFFVSIFTENGPERLFVLMILFIIVLFTVLSFTGALLDKIKNKIYERLSAKTQYYLKIIGKFINYSSVLILAIFSYDLWEKNAIFTAILTLIVLLDTVKNIIDKEKAPAVE